MTDNDAPEDGGPTAADTVRFYSQNGEDCLLWTFFRGRREGFFMDVGAFDGVHLSNTLCFEQQGWRGICVEAQPRYAALCARNRPGSVCVHAAVVGEQGQRTARLVTEDLGLLSGVGLGEEQRRDIRRRYERRGLPFSGFSEIEVPAMTLGMILAEHPPPGEIDLLSVDVEGHEVAALAGIDLRRERPRIVVVEANTSADRDRIWDALVAGAGYFPARRIGENLVLARERSDAAALCAIEGRCVIEPQRHPLGERFTTPALLAGKVIAFGRAAAEDF